jgi:signal transduction histidine kinase
VPIVSSDNNITGAVFITTAEKNMTSVIIGTLMIYLVCGITVLLVAFVVLFFITKSITKPVYNMSEVLHSYARGDYSQRIDIKRTNEFAPLAEAFNSMADGVENLEQMRRGFVADVSHELRTPMTTITGFVDGILDGTIPTDQQTRYLNIVSDEVHRVSRMVSSLLDVAKMQSGQITYVKKPFNFVSCAGKALFAFEDAIERKHIVLDVRFEQDSVIVNGDEDAIYRVVYNLLDNAVKFTDDGGNIKLTIRIVDNKAEFSLYNTGKGINKEDAAHIFERFYKADKSRSENVRGTGIGLYLVKNIIKAHEEDIVLSSKEGEYAKFIFTLPITKE